MPPKEVERKKPPPSDEIIKVSKELDEKLEKLDASLKRILGKLGRGSSA